MHDFAEIEKRVRDDEVTSLDAYESGKADAPVLYRTVSHTVKATAEGKPMMFVASTQDEDRAGDVIMADGWQLDHFKENPVYQWAHDYSAPPIGMVPRIWRVGNQLRNNVKFDSENAFAADIERKFREGFLKAQSVGFKALEFEERKASSGRDGFKFTKAELLEISAVAIPMNQAALMKAYEHAAKAPVFFFMGDAFGAKDIATESPELRDDDGEDVKTITLAVSEYEAEKESIREGAYEAAVEMVSGVFEEAYEDEPESSTKDEQVGLLTGFASALRDITSQENN